MQTHLPQAVPRPEDQLEAIRSMLSAGHRSITLELHSFLLWGLAGAVAFQLLPRFFIPARFPEPLALAGGEFLSATAVVLLTALLDYRLSLRAKQRRDETYSWVQRQMGKLTLLFAFLALILAFGSHFHPWYGVIFVFFIGLMGVTLTAHGFFSERFLVWAGTASIALALSLVLLRFPFAATQWMATAAFGVGVTTLGPLQRWVAGRGRLTRAAALLAWIAAIAVVGVGCYELGRAPLEATVLVLPGR
jgi:hypothetical protein